MIHASNLKSDKVLKWRFTGRQISWLVSRNLLATPYKKVLSRNDISIDRSYTQLGKNRPRR